MPRRSTRKRTQVEAYIESSASDDNENFTPSSRRKSQKKHPRTAKASEAQGSAHPMKYVRGRRGALKQLVEMPLDVLFEIFSHLNLSDILNLSRTNTALRDILLQKSTAFVWRLAHANMGLPDCSPGLNEPQFAKIMFDPLCDYCQETNTHIIIWSIYTRVCKYCLADNEKFCRFHPYDLPWDVTPSVVTSTQNGQEISLYCRRSARELYDHYATLHPEARTQWAQEKREMLKSRIQHSKLCEQWIRARAEQRTTELENMRQRRYDAIKRKLTEIGWGDEFDKMNDDDSYDFVMHPSVRQTRSLTPRIWENIKGQVITFMEEMKTRRLSNEYRAVQMVRRNMLKDAYSDFAASHDLYAIIPGLADIALMPEFETLVDSPAEETLTSAHFKDVFKARTQLIEDWRRSADLELVALMNSSGLYDGATESSLRLPTTFFHCANCFKTMLAYPRVLAHYCTPRLGYESLKLPACDLDLINDIDCLPWNRPRKIHFSQEVYQLATNLLSCCGTDIINPKLEDPPFCIECLTCSSIEHGQAVMTWEGAIYHAQSHSHSKMRRVHLSAEHQLNIAGLVQTKVDALKMVDYFSPVRWVCLACKENFRWDSLISHIKYQHKNGLQSALIEYEDYALYTDHRLSLLQKCIFKIKTDLDTPKESQASAEIHLHGRST